ncbi:hypothetical protein CHCC14820_2517 [Bacillus paralicheniformis]|uniref:Uncharacterized protein n=1 Tax=Bacillus paralicheniformis TaxID=1648923 RepID=A0A7Z1B2T0_9BACI|nr:hypothetical protein SC10_B2orf03442 [Bacillus paralicheniformis]OLF89969.1 hypothetical protein B4121_3244 [Bacillus paralicheniformis]OLG07660.1 hypothetical protein B4125_1841 [Bacillus paralicheniformis]TWJ60741.1 hypothetical protein CHCC5023_0858 [Bacillus paralicheniformis]TWJ80122.1 hypothetical protein CHCC20497_1605 [Bacillus paralicheniformis]
MVFRSFTSKSLSIIANVAQSKGKQLRLPPIELLYESSIYLC